MKVKFLFQNEYLEIRDFQYLFSEERGDLSSLDLVLELNDPQNWKPLANKKVQYPVLQ